MGIRSVFCKQVGAIGLVLFACVQFTDGTSSNHTTFEQFKALTFKWQQRVAKICKECMESKQYVQVRNALVFLSKMMKVCVCWGGLLMLLGPLYNLCVAQLVLPHANI